MTDTVERMLDALSAATSVAAESASTNILVEIMRCQREFARLHCDSAPASVPHTGCEEGACHGERIAVSRDGTHHCTRFCVRHGGTCGVPLAEPRIYWCARHLRVHLCAGVCANTAYTDTLGNRVCVLSGRVVGAALANAFGDGTTSAAAAAPQQARTTARAPRSGSVAEVLRNTNVGVGVGGRRDGTVGGPQAPPPTETYDPDCPRTGLFGDTFEENSIGDGAASALDTLYAQAWGTVHRLLFSKEREAREAARFAAAVAESRKKVNAYLRDRERIGGVIHLDRALSLHDRAMTGALATCPRLRLPRGAILRYTAYYAFAVVVRYLDLMSVADAVVARTKSAERVRRMVARLRTYSEADAFPTVLEMLRDEATDPLLDKVFPDPHTVEHLGITQHTCTEVSKRFKQVLMHAVTLGVPPPPPITRVPEAELLSGSRTVTDYSVVSRFIQIRLAATTL